MAQYALGDCPLAVKMQVQGFVEDLLGLLGNRLIGVYLHGSLAMGCFNPRHSDLDFLVIAEERLSLNTKRSLAKGLLRRSQAPQPIEMSLLVHSELTPWRYPPPFDFHYSETWREQMQHDLVSGNWQRWNDQVRKDPDLAAHVAITKHRGVCVYGAPIPQVFPDVPAGDYLASILGDVVSALERIQEDPVYAVLNACRVWTFLEEGLRCSKREGGLWALSRVPESLRPVVTTALQAYSDEHGRAHFDPGALSVFAAYMRAQLP